MSRADNGWAEGGERDGRREGIGGREEGGRKSAKRRSAFFVFSHGQVSRKKSLTYSYMEGMNTEIFQ
jgi:hypothetical protein